MSPDGGSDAVKRDENRPTEGVRVNDARLLWRVAKLEAKVPWRVAKLLWHRPAEGVRADVSELLRDAASRLWSAAVVLWDNLKKVAYWLQLLTVPVFGVLSVVTGLMIAKPVMQYPAIPIGLVVLNVATAGLMLFSFRRAVQQITSADGQVHVVWAIVVAEIGLSVTCIVIFAAVQFMVWLAQDQHTITLQPAQSELAVKDLYGKAVYQILDAIPILKIPATIGWDDPIPHPAMFGGVVLLLLKLAVIVFIAGLFSRLWVAARAMRRNMRQRNQIEETADDDEPAEALEDGETVEPLPVIETAVPGEDVRNTTKPPK